MEHLSNDNDALTPGAAQALAEINRIRLDEDRTVQSLADDIGIPQRTLHSCLFEHRAPFDRTIHKIQKFLSERRTRDARPRRKAARRTSARA